MVPPMLFPIVLYYPTTVISHDRNISISQTTRNLKRSLSVVLTRYYPLAGRVSIHGRSIDCNDEGVPFVVAKFPGRKLPDLLERPDPNLPCSLLPCEAKRGTYGGPDGSVAPVHVSFFDCGGVAVGAVFSHVTVDGATLASFLKAWSGTARGSREPVCPNYIAQSMFPPKEERMETQLGSSKESSAEFVSQDVPMTGKPVIRRYRFDAAAISSLRAKSGIELPSRVELVSAFLWKSYMAASLSHHNIISSLGHFVNLRRKARPAFSPDCFGNFVAAAAATTSNRTDLGTGDLIGKMRDAVNTIDDDLVNRIRGEEGRSAHDKILLEQKKVPEGVRVDSLRITSWCSFGLYDTDFGWGKPVWVSRCDSGSDLGPRFVNRVWLMDTRNGEFKSQIVQ